MSALTLLNLPSEVLAGVTKHMRIRRFSRLNPVQVEQEDQINNRNYRSLALVHSSFSECAQRALLQHIVIKPFTAALLVRSLDESNKLRTYCSESKSLRVMELGTVDLAINLIEYVACHFTGIYHLAWPVFDVDFRSIGKSRRFPSE
jgi:hypothetical protein